MKTKNYKDKTIMEDRSTPCLAKESANELASGQQPYMFRLHLRPWNQITDLRTETFKEKTLVKRPTI